MHQRQLHLQNLMHSMILIITMPDQKNMGPGIAQMDGYVLDLFLLVLNKVVCQFQIIAITNLHNDLIIT